MFRYDKKLQYPVKIDRPNPKLARIILTQYGGGFQKLFSYLIKHPHTEKCPLSFLPLNFVHEDLTHRESCNAEKKAKKLERCLPEFQHCYTA